MKEMKNMAYRNGTYVAFDGGGDTDITSGDIKYFNLLKAWANSKDIEFTFSDSHQKTYQVSDDSKLSTLRSRLSERINNSKNIFIILSDETKLNNRNLNWEIKRAFECELPFIIVYPDYKRIQNPNSHKNVWPNNLKNLIEANKIKCIHIPFKKEPILDAINQFSVVTKKYPNTSVSYYSDEAYKSWNI